MTMPRTGLPVRVPAKMPAPKDPDPADGPTAFANDATTANANFADYPAWSADIAQRTGNGQIYSSGVFVAQAGWTLLNFGAVRHNHVIELMANLNYTGANVSSTAASVFSPGINVLSIVPPELRPVAGQYIDVPDAKWGNVGVMVAIGYPSADMVGIYNCFKPSVTFTAGLQLTFRCRFFDQTTDRSAAP